MPVNTPQTTVVDDLPVGFQTAGRPDAPRLLLLHGFPMDRRMWAAALAPLAANFHVCAIDLPGFGDSARIAEAQTMTMLADWVVRFMDAAAIPSPVVLCGLSMGGYIALEVAARHPERLSHLVLCDTKTAADSDEARANRLALADSVAGTGMHPIAAAMLPKLVAPRTLANDGEVASEVTRELREMILGCDPASVSAASRGMAARRDTTDVVAGLQIPLLSIVGESDSITSPEVMKQFTDVASQGRLVTIPDAGHVCPMEQPHAFAAAVASLLPSPPPNAGGS